MPEELNFDDPRPSDLYVLEGYDLEEPATRSSAFSARWHREEAALDRVEDWEGFLDMGVS